MHVKDIKKTKGRPKTTWVETVRKYVSAYDLAEDVTLDKMEWPKGICVTDPK